jgi:hypothetical protein
VEILVEQLDLPERGLVELNINRTFAIKVTATEARRKVNGWLLDYVSYMMRALPPTLVISNCIVWRVPIVLTTPDLGAVGELGVVHVDVETGQMDNSDECALALRLSARKVGERLPEYKPRKVVPPEYLATGLMQTHWHSSVQQQEAIVIVSAD